ARPEDRRPVRAGAGRRPDARRTGSRTRPGRTRSSHHAMKLSRLAPLGLLGLLAACASNDTLAPAELTEFRSTADIERVWSASMPKPDARLRLGLGVAAIGEAIVAAGHGGDVIAFNRADGRRLWRTNTRLALTGGPGAGENLVVVGSNSGDVV